MASICPNEVIFLRCFLHSKDKLIMTYEEFKECATKCGFSSSEIEEFLALFRKFFLFSIWRPREKAQATLSYSQQSSSRGLTVYIPAERHFQGLIVWFLTTVFSLKKARDILLDPGNESVSRYDFYTSILNFGLITHKSRIISSCLPFVSTTAEIHHRRSPTP